MCYLVQLKQAKTLLEIYWISINMKKDLKIMIMEIFTWSLQDWSLAAKISESSPRFQLILTQWIPIYQSGMVPMSGGTVQEHQHQQDTNPIFNRI